MNYLLWINIYLIIFYGFYWIFLRNTTFFQLKRFYLLLAAVSSFVLPFVSLSQTISLDNTATTSTSNSIVLAAVTIGQQMNQAVEVTRNSTSVWDLLALLYFTGVIGSLFWLTVRSWMTRKSLNAQADQRAFSFFKRIVIDPKIEGYDRILIHERTHANELHSIDVLLFEIIKIVNWFNPISYVMANSVKLNHEYIADQKSVSSSEERIEYAHLLLSKALATNTPTLTNNFFNRPILKPRIAMLFKDKSKKTTLMSFILLVPALATVIACQSSSANQSDQINTIGVAFQGVASAEKDTSDSSGRKINIEFSGNPNDSSRPQTETAIAKHEDDSLSSDDDEPVFTVTEIMPTFEGGMPGFYRYIADNYVYPEAAVKNGIKGKMLIKFIIEKDGSLSDITVVQDLKYGTGEEAIRVLKNSPKWNPAIQNGRKVRIQFTLPIQLNLPSAGPVDDDTTTVKS